MSLTIHACLWQFEDNFSLAHVCYHIRVQLSTSPVQSLRWVKEWKHFPVALEERLDNMGWYTAFLSISCFIVVVRFQAVSNRCFSFALFQDNWINLLIFKHHCLYLTWCFLARFHLPMTCNVKETLTCFEDSLMYLEFSRSFTEMQARLDRSYEFKPVHSFKDAGWFNYWLNVQNQLTLLTGFGNYSWFWTFDQRLTPWNLCLVDNPGCRSCSCATINASSSPTMIDCKVLAHHFESLGKIQNYFIRVCHFLPSA